MGVPAADTTCTSHHTCVRAHQAPAVRHGGRSPPLLRVARRRPPARPAAHRQVDQVCHALRAAAFGAPSQLGLRSQQPYLMSTSGPLCPLCASRKGATHTPKTHQGAFGVLCSDLKPLASLKYDCVPLRISASLPPVSALVGVASSKPCFVACVCVCTRVCVCVCVERGGDGEVMV
jgi:hypothetical protein